MIFFFVVGNCYEMERGNEFGSRGCVIFGARKKLQEHLAALYFPSFLRYCVVVQSVLLKTNQKSIMARESGEEGGGIDLNRGFLGSENCVIVQCILLKTNQKNITAKY